jgi:transposase
MAARAPWEVSDEVWELVEPLIPRKERRLRYPGRRRLPDREALCGILFVLHTGIAWMLAFAAGARVWVGVHLLASSGRVAAGRCQPYRHLRGLRSQEWITKSRYLKQEFQRHQRPPEHQSLSSLRPSEFAESSGSLPRTARSSTCAARCPSATASGAGATSIRDRLVPIGLRRPTTTQGSGRMEGTSLRTTSGWRICSATDVTTDGV